MCWTPVCINKYKLHTSKKQTCISPTKYIDVLITGWLIASGQIFQAYAGCDENKFNDI